MDKKEKISVAMATYNGAEYLEEQLESIRTQTLPPDELIICDDRSKDNTVEVAKKYIQEHNLSDSWKVYVNEENLGYADNFHKAAKLTTGDMIFFSDQDDTWRKDKIEIMMGIMGEHPDCAVLCTDYYPWYVGENAPEAPKAVLDRMPDNGILEKITLSKRSIYIGALGCCMCARRSFYDSIDAYWFDGWAQDDRMWRMSQCADGCYILHSNLVNHRIHANNTSTFGKYHTIEKRVKLFTEMRMADEQMLKRLLDNSANDGKQNRYGQITQKHIRMMELRIELIQKRKIMNSLLLLRYIAYYERIKSFMVEIYMALKGR